MKVNKSKWYECDTYKMLHNVGYTLYVFCLVQKLLKQLFYKNEGLFFQIHYAQVNKCWFLSLIVILIIDYVHCIDFVPSTECVYKWCIPPLPLAELLLYSIYYSVYYSDTDLTYMLINTPVVSSASDWPCSFLRCNISVILHSPPLVSVYTASLYILCVKETEMIHSITAL